MAHGMKCRFCGWKESEHDADRSENGTPVKLQGYALSLKRCPGFEPQEPRLHAELEAIRAQATAGQDPFLKRLAREHPD